jgi:hypothetical protein
MNEIEAYLKLKEQQAESKSTPEFAALLARRRGQFCLQSGQQSGQP